MLLCVIFIYALQFLQGISSDKCETDNGGCSQLCTNTTDSFHCLCNEGYELEADNRTCVDVNECRTFGSCSQICENEEGGFKCHCVDGYIVDPLDTTRCKAKERDVSLLLYRSFHISKISLGDSKMRTKIVSPCSIGMDFHFKTGMLFWRHNENGTIFKSPVSRGKITPVGNLTINDGHWTVDWIYNRIYLLDSTDRDHHIVKVTDFEGSTEKILFEDLDVRSPLVLDPAEGWIFWINKNHGSEIERGGMDGSRRQTIVSDDVLANPTALTLDYTLKRLYWADNGRKMIFCSFYDGANILIVSVYRPNLQIDSMTVFEDWIYFTDTNEGVFRVEKFNGKFDASPIAPSQKHNFVTFSVVHVYHPSKQPDSENYCQDAKCSHLCLPAPQIDQDSPKITCACPEGLRLNSDNMTCVDKDGVVAVGLSALETRQNTLTVSININGTMYQGTLYAEKSMNNSSSP